MNLAGRGGRRRGFTLIEMAVVLAVMGIMFAIATPPWRRYRASMSAQASAQELRAELTFLQSRSIDLEEECFLRIDSATQYSTYLIPVSQYSASARPYKRIVVGNDGLQLSPSGAGTLLVFGSKGWVDTTKSTVTSSGSGGSTYYPITVSAPNVLNVSVRTYLNGRVLVQ